MTGETETTQPVQTIVASFSITMNADQQEPLVAARILIDGTPVGVPFVLALGSGAPVVVFDVARATDKVAIAGALNALAATLSGEALAQITAVLKKLQGGAPNEPASDLTSE